MGISPRYDFGNDHPLIGRSVPGFELVDGTRVGSLMHDGRELLLDFDSATSLQTLASRRRDRLIYVATDAQDRPGLRAVLVRPDGFIAWACEDAPDKNALVHALSRWFGEPEGVGNQIRVTAS